MNLSAGSPENVLTWQLEQLFLPSLVCLIRPFAIRYLVVRVIFPFVIVFVCRSLAYKRYALRQLKVV